MRDSALRRPYVFSLLVSSVLLGLIFVSRFPFPTTVVGDAGELDPGQIRQPTELDRAISSINNAETLYLVLALLLAILLASVLGMWREVGLNRPAPSRNLLLLWFPLLVIGLTLSGGIRFPGVLFFGVALLAVALEAFGSELLFRGVMWRALAPVGLLRAVIFTSILSGGLTLVSNLSAGPWPEAVYLTLTATCGGFTYAAIRWRTASIWPAIAVHLALALSIDFAVIRPAVFSFLLFATTFGFIGYGLLLLRNQRVRGDGGMSAHKPARVR